MKRKILFTKLNWNIYNVFFKIFQVFDNGLMPDTICMARKVWNTWGEVVAGTSQLLENNTVKQCYSTETMASSSEYLGKRPLD